MARSRSHVRTLGAPTRPPLALLALAAAAIAASYALLYATGELVDLAGYVLAMIIAALAIVGYRTIESRRRTRAGYVAPRLGPVPVHFVVWLLLALGVVIGAAHVWRFADAVAR